MTTTVTVHARAWGATVDLDGETTEIGPNREHSFHIEEGTKTFTVTQPAEAPAGAAELSEEEVPGRAQNDELLGGGAARKRGSGSPASTDEAAQTTS